jgi:ribonuclease J
VLTHAHEDHIGAIGYLWEDLGCKIYATPFVTTLLREKFLDNRYTMPSELVSIDLASSKLTLGPFDLEFVNMCHSIPEMQALLIGTEVGRIFHTGDWKYDQSPMVGPVNNDTLLKKYGDDGILAVIGDSTNVFHPGHSGSEGELRKSLIELIKPCSKLVVVATFSSNIARIESLIEAAITCGRKVVLSGRNLRRIFTAGVHTGYLQNAKKVDFVDEKEASKYSRDKLLVIATGCQGEPSASVTKMASREHKFITLEHGDSVIFSSKVIPGNDAKIYRVFDKLIMMGVHVLMEQTDFTHVSGHPGQLELKKLYSLLRPKVLIPVHGENLHLQYHKRLAHSWGVERVTVIADGDVVKFSAAGSAERVGKVQAGALAVYGNILFNSNSPMLQARRSMRDNGVCFIVLCVSTRGDLASDPIIRFPGYLEEENEKELIAYMQDEITQLLENGPRNSKSANAGEIDKLVKARVKSILRQEIARVPPIYVVINII